MSRIERLGDIAAELKKQGVVRTIAVACAEDSNTVGSLARAAEEGFAKPMMFGDEEKIRSTADAEGVSAGLFEIVHEPDPYNAVRAALKAVKDGRADILMKGLVGTDKFLKAVLDKEEGLLPKGAVMSYTCAVEIPEYDRLLFISDTAVLPFPDLLQKKAMIEYSVAMARRFGVEMPRVALVGASEKVSASIPGSLDYAMLSVMNKRGQISDCIVDGPLDIFCACDPESLRIKGVETPIEGKADVLIFPSLEACNAFYKGLMLFAKGELAGLIQGTEKPVVVMSRSESAASKFYCVALACLMSD